MFKIFKKKNKNIPLIQIEDLSNAHKIFQVEVTNLSPEEVKKQLEILKLMSNFSKIRVNKIIEIPFDQLNNDDKIKRLMRKIGYDV